MSHRQLREDRPTSSARPRSTAGRGDHYRDAQHSTIALPQALQRLRGGRNVAVVLRAAGMNETWDSLLSPWSRPSTPWTVVMSSGGSNDPDADGTTIAPVEGSGEPASDALQPHDAVGAGAQAVWSTPPHTAPLVPAERSLGNGLLTAHVTRDFLALAELHGERLQKAAQTFAECYVPNTAILGREILAHDLDSLLTHYRTYAASWPRYREALTATLDAVLQRLQGLTLAHGRNAAEFLIQELLPTHLSLVGVSNDLLLLQAGLQRRYGRDETTLRRVYDEVHRADPERIDAVLELADLMDQQHQIVALDTYPSELTVARAVERVVHRRTLRRLPQLMDAFPWTEGKDQLKGLHHEVGQLLDHIERFRIHGAVELLETYRNSRWLSWHQRLRMRNLADRLLRMADTEAARRVYLGRYKEAAQAGRSKEATAIWHAFQTMQAASAVRAGAGVAVSDPTAVRELPYEPSALREKISRNERGRISRPQIRDALQILADATTPGVRVELQDGGCFVVPAGMDPNGSMEEWAGDLSNRHQRLRVHIPADVSATAVRDLLRQLRDHLYGRLSMEQPVYHYFQSVDLMMADAAAAAAAHTALLPMIAEAGLGTVRIFASTEPEPVAVLASHLAPMYRIAVSVPIGSTATEQRQFLAQALYTQIVSVARARVVVTGFETDPAPQIRMQLDLQIPEGTAPTLAESALQELLQPLAHGTHTDIDQLSIFVGGLVASLGAGGIVAGGLQMLGAAEATQVGAFMATWLGGVFASILFENYFLQRRGFVFVDELNVRVNGESVLQVRDERNRSNAYARSAHHIHYTDSALGRSLATNLRWREPITEGS